MSQIPNSPYVIVQTSARIHMGFFDLNGQIGRRFGSIGLSLNSPNTIIEVSLGQEDASADYVNKSKCAILDYFQIKEDVCVKLIEQIPRHSGLGSGTQMALAIGAGICKLLDLNLNLADIAYIIGRGSRSGIGIGAFEQGGLILDAGRGAHTKVPPIIARYDFPEEWAILLIFDLHHTGVHGAEEVNAFNTLKAANLSDTEKISHQILMQAIPALLERDLEVFGKAISALQRYTGDYFSPAQGGLYASAEVAQVLEYLQHQGVKCFGQSSWGPTGFAIFETKQIANEHLTGLKQTFKTAHLDWLICSACNTGAELKIRNSP